MSLWRPQPRPKPRPSNARLIGFKLFIVIMDWVERIQKAVLEELHRTENDDGSHDIGHFQRVSALSCSFAREEKANELVAYTAGMLHDIVNLPKNHPNRKLCSQLASERASEILVQIQFPAELIDNVCHAIHAHSFSANVEPNTIEAKCVQDADRMEALGAFGLMRTFYVSGKFGSKIMHEIDPEGQDRNFNDKEYALDHFPLKLLTLYGTMKTEAGRKTALSLSRFLEDFRNEMITDHRIGNKRSSHFQIAEIFYEAGERSAALFNLDDPFGVKRIGDPKKFALDGLLNNSDPSILKFMDQLRFELKGYQN